MDDRLEWRGLADQVVRNGGTTLEHIFSVDDGTNKLVISLRVETKEQHDKRVEREDQGEWQPGIECEHGYDACPICDK